MWEGVAYGEGDFEINFIVEKVVFNLDTKR